MGTRRDEEKPFNDDLDDALNAMNSTSSQTGTTVEEYVNERTRLEDRDVISALREVDSAETVRWSINRYGDADPARDGFIGEVVTEMLTLDNLARRFGPGNYRIIGKYPTGQYAASRRVKIASDASAVKKENSVNTSMSGTPSWDEWMRREEQRRESARKERNELLAILIPALSPIIAAMIGNKGPDIATLAAALKPPPPPTMPEMMTALASLKALAPEQTQDPIDRALKLLEVIQDKAPTVGETGWMDLAREALKAVAPVIGPVVADKLASGVSTHSPSVALPGPIPTANPSSSENPQMLAMLKLLPWFKTQMEMALAKATRIPPSDPALIAERVCDDLPDDVQPLLLKELIEREDWWQQMQRLEPRVSPHIAWFTELRKEILAQFEETPPSMTTKVIEPKSQEIDRPQKPPSLV